MKKLFSLCLMSMAAAGMMAADLPFTVSPEPGSTVESLDAISLTIIPGQGYEWFDIDSYGVSLRRDGEVYCAVGSSESADYQTYTFIPETPVTEPGVYELIFDEWALNCSNDEGDPFYYNDEPLVFSYTVGNGGDTPSELPFSVLEPQGETLNTIDYVVFQLDPESGFTDFVVSDEGGYSFTKDGEFYSAAKAVAMGSMLQVLPQEFIMSSGEYALVINEGALSWKNDEVSETNVRNLEYTFTVEAAEQEQAFTVSPASGSLVESITEVVFTVDEEKGYISIYMDDPESAAFYRDGELFCGVDYEEDDDLVFFTLTPKEAITEPGVYELVVNANNIFAAGTGDYYMNFTDLTFTYTVAAPVEYDVMPTSYKPADGSEIDFDMRDFSSVTLNVAEGILPAEGAEAFIVPIGFEDEAVVAKIEKVKNMNQLIINFEPMMYNGKYEVYIPEASFGDELWLSNPQAGHTNPEISLTYTLVNAMDRESGVDYTLVPEVTYSPDYKTFTLKFEEGVKMGSFAFATFANEEAKYSKYALFTDNGDSTFTVEFDEAPEVSGNYTFMVERGMFGDEEFISSNEESGVANEAVSMVIEVIATGIDSVGSGNEAKAVYNLHGVKVAESVDNLPAGIYVVDGKKVVVRK